MPAKLAVKNLVKRYEAFEAVRDVSFEVMEGEVFGLLGPNGAGKTTTVECIIGLRRPDEGSIELCGLDALTELNRVKQRIGVALQSTALQDKITPREAIKLFGSFYPKRVADDVLISRFSLNDKADSPFDSLSGGQRQRLALALAFVNDPEVLFLDEPTTGLDPQARRDLHADILKLRQEGRTIVLTTHYLHEAQSLCDRVAIIDHGKVIAIGKPEELISSSKATQHIEFRAAKTLDSGRLTQLGGVTGVESINGNTVLTTGNVSSTLTNLVHLLDEDQNALTDVKISRAALEDVFLQLTARAE